MSIGCRVAISRNARMSSAPSSSDPVWRGPVRARLRRGLEHALQRPVGDQEVAGGLLADALGAGQAVGRVAAQGDEVGDLLGLDAVAAADLGRADLLGPSFAAPPRGNRTVTLSLTHWNMSRSPVKRSVSPPASVSSRAKAPRRSSASSVGCAWTVHPKSSYSAGASAHWLASPSGIGGRSAW